MNNNKVITNHMIIKIENDQVFFVCSAAPKMEMITFGAPKKCSVCSCVNPAPLDGREESCSVDSGREYDHVETVPDLVTSIADMQ